MDHRKLYLAGILAASMAGPTGVTLAETIAIDGGIAVKQTAVATPTRGMTMEEVAAKFGAPVNKVEAIGKPPISRWEYPGFVVYFEHQHVIHSVVSAS